MQQQVRPQRQRLPVGMVERHVAVVAGAGCIEHHLHAVERALAVEVRVGVDVAASTQVEPTRPRPALVEQREAVANRQRLGAAIEHQFALHRHAVERVGRARELQRTPAATVDDQRAVADGSAVELQSAVDFQYVPEIEDRAAVEVETRSSPDTRCVERWDARHRQRPAGDIDRFADDLEQADLRTARQVDRVRAVDIGDASVVLRTRQPVDSLVVEPVRGGKPLIIARAIGPIDRRYDAEPEAVGQCRRFAIHRSDSSQRVRTALQRS